MFSRFYGVAFLWALVFGHGWAAGQDKKELAKLEGTWILVKAEANGKSLLEKDRPKPKMVIKDGKITSDDKEAPKGAFELAKILDPSKKPRTITLPLEGKIKFYGIYELVGDELRVCGVGSDSATEKNRPKKFDSDEKLLIVFKRQKKEGGCSRRWSRLQHILILN